MEPGDIANVPLSTPTSTTNSFVDRTNLPVEVQRPHTTQTMRSPDREQNMQLAAPEIADWTSGAPTQLAVSTQNIIAQKHSFQTDETD